MRLKYHKNTYTTNTSGTIGVSYNKKYGVWCSYLGSTVRENSHGGTILGMFPNKEAAINSRKLAELKNQDPKEIMRELRKSKKSS